MKFISALPRNALLALILALVVIVWMLSGPVLRAFKAPPEAADEQTEPTHQNVQVEAIILKNFEENLTLIGRSTAQAEASISAQTAGEISKIQAFRGDKITRNQPLLTIAISNRQKDLSAAKSRLQSAKVLAKTAENLFTEGFASEARLAQARADLATAAQEVSTIEKDIAHTKVTAPINGVVEERFVDVGDFVDIGTPLYSIVNQDAFLIVGFAAQEDLKHIQLGHSANATLANGQTVAGNITFIATRSDAETRTYRIDLKIDGAEFQIPTGMTADIKIPITATQAAFLKHAHLVLDATGRVGVMLAVTNETGAITAQFYPIEIVQDAPNGIWVKGLEQAAKNGSQLIIRGQANLTNNTLINIQTTNTDA